MTKTAFQHLIIFNLCMFQNSALRKKALQPPKPMKPLYWTRIVAPPTKPAVDHPPQLAAPEITVVNAADAHEITEVDSGTKSMTTNGSSAPTTPPIELWQRIEEASLENLDEFTELFSRRAVVPKPVIDAAEAAARSMKKIATVKVLDSKRSQKVGIFSRSLHVDFAEIEHAIYHCDTSVVSLEALKNLMEMKATDDEIKAIRLAANPAGAVVETTTAAVPAANENDSTVKCNDDSLQTVVQPPAAVLPVLDGPEQFLLRISNLSCSAERISCIVFQVDFDEGCIAVSRKLDIVWRLCEFLLYSDELRHLFSIILTLGNYMNGGNHVRGQADGFGLEILSKLKDVKSSDPRLTLLHFIVKTYIERCRKAGTPLQDVQLPIPDPGDVVKTLPVDYQEVKNQVQALQRKVERKSAERFFGFFFVFRFIDFSILFRNAKNYRHRSGKIETRTLGTVPFANGNLSIAGR